MAASGQKVVGVIVVVLIAGGLGFYNASRKQREEKALADMKREQSAIQADLKRELDATGTIDAAKSMERTRQFAAAVEKATANMSEHDAGIMRALMKTMMSANDEIEPFMKRNQAAGEALLFAPKNLGTKEALDKADAEVEWMKGESHRLERVFADIPNQVRSAVTAAGASSSEASQIVQGLQGSGRINLMVSIRQADGHMFTQMQKQHALLRAHLGKWKATDEGVVTFEDAAAQAEFDAAVEEFARVSAAQDRDIRALVEMGG